LPRITSNNRYRMAGHSPGHPDRKHGARNLDARVKPAHEGMVGYSICAR
jgi:hypothetical protein